MRVLFSYGLVGRGGDAIQVQQMVEALQSLGHTVRLIGPEPLRPYEFGTSMSKARSLARRLPWWAKDVLELALNRRLSSLARGAVQREHYDLLLHRASIYDFVGAQLARRIGIPLIVQLDAPFALERTFHGAGHFARLHRRCVRRLGEAARLVFTVSAASRDYYAGLGIPSEKILVVPNGIPDRLLRRGRELARQHPPFSQGKERCVIGFVGSLARWHGVSLLLQALRELGAPEYPRWRLRIIGYGEEYAKLRDHARELGVDACVDWLGALPHEQAFEQIAQFDIAVLPNTLPTGVPIKLFEYAALARPIIAPDLPNVRAWFTEEEMRFVSSQDPKGLAKALLELVEATAQARMIGQKAQGRVSDYTWEKIVQRILVTAGFGR